MLLMLLLLAGFLHKVRADDRYKDLKAGRLIGLTLSTWPSDFAGIAKAPFADQKKS